MVTAPNISPMIRIPLAIIVARTTAENVYPRTISKYENGAINISSILLINRPKYTELELCANEDAITLSIKIPGKTKVMYCTPAISEIFDPIT